MSDFDGFHKMFGDWGEKRSNNFDGGWDTIPKIETFSTPIEQREKRLKKDLEFAKEQLEETRRKLKAKEVEHLDLKEKFMLVKDALEAKRNIIKRMAKIIKSLREKIERLGKFNRFEVMDLEEDND